jgi:acyl carrier protein
MALSAGAFNQNNKEGGTMTQNEKITQLIFDAIDDINAQSSKEQQLEKSINTALYGEEGKLDSLGLVNFIVAVEHKIQDKLGLTITLATERAMSQKNSPFRSVQSLLNYITLLLEENDK